MQGVWFAYQVASGTRNFYSESAAQAIDSHIGVVIEQPAEAIKVGATLVRPTWNLKGTKSHCPIAAWRLPVAVAPFAAGSCVSCRSTRAARGSERRAKMALRVLPGDRRQAFQRRRRVRWRY